jgi:hypothetical protein
MDKALPSGGRDCGFESRLGLNEETQHIFVPSPAVVDLDYSASTHTLAC